MSSPFESISSELDDEDDMSSSLRYVNSEPLSQDTLKYEYLHGRRYYNARKYLLPNDEKEQERMDSLHIVWKTLLDGQLMRSTLKNPRRILDIGTGTGTWAIDVADVFSKADVVGIDLSPIQCPDVPPNCHFFIDDCEGLWDWEEHFDLIHGRCLGGSIANWRRFYKQSFQNLVPGGRVEIQEHDFLISSQSKDVPPWTSLWLSELNAAFKTSGKDLHVPAERHIQYLEAAGFVDVKVDTRSLPIGAWAKDERLKKLGEWNQQQMLDLVESYSLAAYTDIMRRSLEETQVTIAMTKSELREKRHHLLIKFHFITGTKPCVNSNWRDCTTARR